MVGVMITAEERAKLTKEAQNSIKLELAKLTKLVLEEIDKSITYRTEKGEDHVRVNAIIIARNIIELHRSTLTPNEVQSSVIAALRELGYSAFLTQALLHIEWSQ
ncbi:hypothetical protein BRC2024_PQPTKSFJ_CDS_0073 [Tegunavirus sp. BRC001]